MKWFIVISLFVYYSSLSEGSAIGVTPNEAIEKLPEVIDGTEQAYIKTTESSTFEDVRIEEECLPRSEWQSNCHSCRCSDAGRAICTKLDVCDKGIFGEPLKCKPQTSFKRDCNTCRCLDNGLVLCTLKGCSKLTIPDESKILPGKECSPGTRWKSRCNECVCSPEGLTNCSKNDCPGQENEPEMHCAPDSIWKDDCNSCWCTTSGYAMCTRIGCSLNVVTNWNPKPNKKVENTTPQADKNPAKSLPASVIENVFRKKRATSQGTPKNCQPNQEFRLDCNKCLCDNEGQNFSCTRIDCTALNNNNNGGDRAKREVASQEQKDCPPGSVFDQGCNVCQCTKDGNHAVCTMKRCHEETTDNDINAPESDPNFRCNPGEQFKRGCKDCTCSADGKSVFCTLRLCDQDINPAL